MRFLSILVIAAAACASNKAELKPNPEVPASTAAQGTVEATEVENGNTRVDVRVRHLAPPDKVAPEATTYVVWARAKVGESKPQNLGALKVNDDREGRLETVTPLRSFDVMVTPESSSEISAPAHAPVFTTSGER
jgi:hypothetical protein